MLIFNKNGSLATVPFGLDGYLKRWARGAAELRFKASEEKESWILRLKEEIQKKRADIERIENKLAEQEEKERRRKEAEQRRQEAEKRAVIDFLNP